MTDARAGHESLEPLFRALRWAIHVLVVTLGVWALGAALAAGDAWRATGAAALLALYVAGAVLRARLGRWARMAWFAAVVAVWASTLGAHVIGLYLAFPLFFVAMAVVPGIGGPVALAIVTALALVGQAIPHDGLGMAGAVGTIIGAIVALVTSLFVRALAREAHAREAAMVELVATQGALARAERLAGAMGERERLARDIHDTVSQSLSSIVMLLHAAERQRDAGNDAALEIAQARDAAGHALGETRSLIDELAPPELRRTGLGDALARLAAQTEAASGIRVLLTIDGTDEAVRAIPTRVEVALLRIAQSAVANAVQHAGTASIDLSLDVRSGVRLEVADAGAGFDAGAEPPESGLGIRGMRARAAELGGTIDIASDASGTCVTATFDDDPREAA